jgi:exonuclease SbcD
VYIVSEVGEKLDSLIVPLDERSGKEKTLIGCLPYLHPHQVLSAADGAGTSEDARMSAYQAKLQDYFRALEDRIKRRDRQAVALMLAHIDIQGSEFGGGEWRSNVFSLNGAILPAHVHYVALGHIHKPQPAPGAKAHARYAGSILQMDFGEREQQKSVCLIEAHPGKPAAVTQIPLTKGKRLLRRNGTAEAILEQAPHFTNAWVEVVLSPDKRTAELIDKIRALPEVIALRFEDAQDATANNDDTGRRSHIDRPAGELFREYYKSKKKADPEPQLVELFERLYQEASASRETED